MPFHYELSPTEQGVMTPCTNMPDKSMKDLLIDYARYNLWANEKIYRLLESASAVEASLLDKEIPSSFNTLRKTITHILYAEMVWYRRLHGESPQYSKEDMDSILSNGSPRFAREATVPFPEFKKQFLSQSQQFIEYVQNLDEEKLNTDFDYKAIDGSPYRNKIWQSVHHCFNHSTFHRGQLITMLRNVGYTDLSSTDFITYIRER